jgi:hypothetical protein
MRSESRPGSLSGLPDDQLATAAVSLVAAELQWTPDVSPAVMDRISRDAVAYPEQFDRRPAPEGPPPPPAQSSRSAKRTAGRIVVFGVMLAIIVALVLFAATANASAADLEQLAIEQGSRTFHVVTETS